MAISEKNSVEKEKFIGGERYLLSNLYLKLEREDITKWPGYDKIKVLSNLVNRIKKNIYRISF